MSRNTRSRRRTGSTAALVDEAPPPPPPRCSYCNQTQSYFNEETDCEIPSVVSGSQYGVARTKHANRLYGCLEEGCTTAPRCIECILADHCDEFLLREAVDRSGNTAVRPFGSRVKVTVGQFKWKCPSHNKLILDGHYAIIQEPVPWYTFGHYDLPEWAMLFSVLLLVAQCVIAGSWYFVELNATIKNVYYTMPLIAASVFVFMYGIGNAFGGNPMEYRLWPILLAVVASYLDPYQLLWLQRVPVPHLFAFVIHLYVLGAVFIGGEGDPTSTKFSVRLRIMDITRERRV